MTVSWSGVSSPTTHDWIGLYHPGDANYRQHRLGVGRPTAADSTAGHDAKSSGSCSFTMSVPAGTYEFRLFSNDSYTTRCDLEHGHRWLIANRRPGSPTVAKSARKRQISAVSADNRRSSQAPREQAKPRISAGIPPARKGRLLPSRRPVALGGELAVP